jgi:hypothetical protein
VRFVTSGLDAEKLEILRRWGAGLEGDGREEVSAAGRAILLLIEEVERLHVLVWDRRLYPDESPPAEPTSDVDESAATAAAEDSRARWSLTNVLRERLQQRERDGPFPQPESAPEEPFHS